MPLGLFRGVRTFRLEPRGDDGTSVRGCARSTRDPCSPLIWRTMPDLGPSFTRFAEGLTEAESRRASLSRVGAPGDPSLTARSWCSGQRAARSGAQRRAPDLAARRARELVREVDDARVLVGRRRGLRVLLQLARERGRRREPSRDHDRAHDAPRSASGAATTAASATAGCADERRLHLERPDPVSGGDDHVVGAALEVQVALLVGAHPVAGLPRPACGGSPR